MRIAVLHVELHIPYSHSLKEKRMVLRRVKDRLQKFNVGVAEVEHQDLWQRARLAVVSVNTDHGHLDATLSHATSEASNARDIMVLDAHTEIL
jgi:uncharacterized protein YlxP (DUF503 family)